MTTDQALLERVVKLETEMTHLQEGVDDMSKKVTAIHDLLTQAKGARWLVLVAVATVAFATGSLDALLKMIRG